MLLEQLAVGLKVPPTLLQSAALPIHHENGFGMSVERSLKLPRHPADEAGSRRYDNQGIRTVLMELPIGVVEALAECTVIRNTARFRVDALFDLGCFDLDVNVGCAGSERELQHAPVAPGW